MSSSVPFSISVPGETLGAWVLIRDERTVYDEWNPVAQIAAARQVVQRHLWGTDLSGTPQGAGGVGGLLGTWDNGATTRDGSEPGDGVARVWVCAYDGNGNVSAAIAATVAGGGASGAGGAETVRVARYAYDAFGKTLATWGDGAVAEANRYRFSTKPVDGTGLLYYGYRYLDTRMGRWLNRDPIKEKGGTNLYAFNYNSPLNWVDVLGKAPLPPPLDGLGNHVGSSPGTNCSSKATDGGAPFNATPAEMTKRGCRFVPQGPCQACEKEVIVYQPSKEPPIDKGGSFHVVGEDPAGGGYHHQVGSGNAYFNNVPVPNAAAQCYYDNVGGGKYKGDPLVETRYCCKK